MLTLCYNLFFKKLPAGHMSAVRHMTAVSKWCANVGLCDLKCTSVSVRCLLKKAEAKYAWDLTRAMT